MIESDYYALFGLEPKLCLDANDLQQRFYRISREMHPDRYQTSTRAERAIAEETTARLNDAYRILRDPVARAEYFLRRRGLETPGGRRAPAALLEEVFEMNEALEEFRSGDASARERLAEARRKLKSSLAETDASVQRLSEDYDSRGAEDALTAIRAELDRRKYIQNLVAQIESELSSE